VPFAGFWSKDEILAHAFNHGHPVVFVVLIVAAFLTAFYMTRQWRLVFFGQFRGERPVVFQNPEPPRTPARHDSDAGHSADPHATGHDAAGHATHRHLNTGARWHESPLLITPLVVLAS